MVQVLALKTAEEAQKDAEYLNGHDRKRQRTEASVPGLDMTDDEDEVRKCPLFSSVLIKLGLQSALRLLQDQKSYYYNNFGSEISKGCQKGSRTLILSAKL